MQDFRTNAEIPNKSIDCLCALPDCQLVDIPDADAESRTTENRRINPLSSDNHKLG